MGSFDITRVNDEFFEYVDIQKTRIEGSSFATSSAKYYEARKHYSISENTIFFEAYSGRGMIDNPNALFQSIFNDQRFKDYKFIWVLEDNDLNRIAKEKYSDHDNILFVAPDSDEYFEWLSRAKYLVNNVTFKPYFTKKEGQVVINTWHGIPLKNMGYDEVNGNISTANMVRNFLFTDYILSASEYTTNLFRTAYKLNNLYPGKYIEAGSPRVDLSFNTEESEIFNELKSAGVKVDANKKIVVYAPTWTGSYSRPEIDIDQFDLVIKTIEDSLGTENYQVLFKPHQIVYKFLLESSLMKENYIPASIDTNRLLSVTDVLITDFSSIFFDYLPLNRKTFFYIPDYDIYKNERGIYFDIESLPGPICYDLGELGAVLKQIDNYNNSFDQDNLVRYKKIVSNEDGSVCKRIIDAVFFGDTDNVITESFPKKRLLFHTDVVLRNGISASLLNLLTLLDTEKYDITFYAIGNKDLVREYVDKLPDSIRVIYRSSGIVGDPIDCARRFYCTDKAIVDIDNHLFPDYLYKTEYNRCFGDAYFDCIINFSGFSSFFVNILRFAKKTKQLIWMHNVMKEEYERVSEGEKVFETTLNNVFQLYPEFDRCVSCSESTMLHNRKDLATESTYHKFDFLSNSININNIKKGSQSVSEIIIDGQRYLIIESSNDSLKRRIVPSPKNENYNFVCMGRLADAKNHANLIKAFSRFTNEHKNSRLYIIGDGPLHQELEELINALNLKDKVILTGNISNPFGIMSKCDCFILPSYYEGQPMVILEARCLGLAIIESNFETVKDSMLPNGQLIIGTTIDEIYKGLVSFVNGDVPTDYSFDAEEYNRNIVDKFYSFIEKEA